MGNGGSGGGMPKCPVRPYLFWAVQFGVQRNLLLMLGGGRSGGLLCGNTLNWLLSLWALSVGLAVGGEGGLMSCTYLDAGAAAGQVLPGGSCCQVSVVRVPTSPP